MRFKGWHQCSPKSLVLYSDLYQIVNLNCAITYIHPTISKVNNKLDADTIIKISE